MIKNFAIRKSKYFIEYGNAISEVFRKIRYGIASCCVKDDLDLITIRYELAEWQSSPDYSTLSEIRRRNIKWAPFIVGNDDLQFININIVNGAAESFKFDPAVAVWYINYDLPFTPNVTTTDLAGQEISGVVTYLNASTLSITFSEPVSGWAYLS